MNIETKCIDTIRCLSMDAVQKANSGHPGTPMALAPAAYALWMNHLKYNPKKTITDAQINAILALFPKNFYDLTLTDVNNIRDAVAAPYNFEDVKDIL